MSRSDQLFARMRERAARNAPAEPQDAAPQGSVVRHTDPDQLQSSEPQDAIPHGYQGRPDPDAPRGLTANEMTRLRYLIQMADAEQLTIAMSLIFTQIREAGYTLSAPIDSMLWGQAPAWRILNGQGRTVGRVAWQNGEWTTETGR